MGAFAEEVEKRRLEYLMQREPSLDNGSMRVLREMAGDLDVYDWARRLDSTVLEIERACAWLGVKTLSTVDANASAEHVEKY